METVAVTLDKGHMKTLYRIHKFLDPSDTIAELAREGMPIDDLVDDFGDKFLGMDEFEKNLLLNEGINELWTLVCDTTGTKFNNANANIGVGDSSTAEAATQTGLQAAVNKLYKAMDAGFPTFGTSQKASWRSTFGSAEANFVWNEITVANGTSDTAKNLNRKVQAMGTKASGSTWIVTLEITLS